MSRKIKAPRHSKARGHTKTFSPRTMYRQPVQTKAKSINSIHPLVKSAIEAWVVFSSLFTIVQIFIMIFG